MFTTLQGETQGQPPSVGIISQAKAVPWEDCGGLNKKGSHEQEWAQLFECFVLGSGTI